MKPGTDKYMENGNGKKIEHRLTALETKMDTILINHLPHLEKQVKDLNTKFWAIIILLISNLVGLVFTLIK